MMYICHIFFIQSIVDGHLGWFQVFAIVISGAMNVSVHVFLYRMIYNPLGIYPVMGLLGQMEFLYVGPWGRSTLSSTMVELIYTPTNSGIVFLFLHILSSIYCLQINDHHSNWHEMISQCGFDLHFSNDQWWWEFFHVCWPHVCLLL